MSEVQAAWASLMRFGSLMSVVGTNRTNRAGLRCPLFGEDRKWLAEGQTGAIDPEQTFGQLFRKAKYDLCRRPDIKGI
jgi:hypothetical protein